MRGYLGLVTVVAFCALVLWNQSRREHLLARETSQRALMLQIVRLIAEYRHEHDGEVPESLADLPLTYPDGGDPSFLDLFEYELLPFDGYRLKTTYVFTGTMMNMADTGDGRFGHKPEQPSASDRSP